MEDVPSHLQVVVIWTEWRVNFSTTRKKNDFCNHVIVLTVTAVINFVPQLGGLFLSLANKSTLGSFGTRLIILCFKGNAKSKVEEVLYNL